MIATVMSGCGGGLGNGLGNFTNAEWINNYIFLKIIKKKWTTCMIRPLFFMTHIH